MMGLDELVREELRVGISGSLRSGREVLSMLALSRHVMAPAEL